MSVNDSDTAKTSPLNSNEPLQVNTVSTDSVVTTPSANLWIRLFHAAWMSIAFGIALELLLLLVTTLAGKESGIKPFVRDLLQKISWSVFVCVGLAIGTTVTKAM